MPERIELSKKQEVVLRELQKSLGALQNEVNELKRDRGANERSALRNQSECGDEKSNSQFNENPTETEK